MNGASFGNCSRRIAVTEASTTSCQPMAGSRHPPITIGASRRSRWQLARLKRGREDQQRNERRTEDPGGR